MVDDWEEIYAWVRNTIEEDTDVWEIFKLIRE